MAFSNFALFDALRTVAFGGITGTYAVLGTKMAHPARAFKITNNTDGDLFIAITNGSTPSSGGTEDNIFVPAGGFVLYDVSSDSVPVASPLFAIAKGEQFWVRQSTAPTVRSVYLEVLYGKGE